MPDKCRYARKKKKLLKGYYWCNRWNEPHKYCGCKKWCYKPKFPKSLFVWLGDKVYEFSYLLEGVISGRR